MSGQRGAEHALGADLAEHAFAQALRDVGQANIQIPLVAPETEYTPRINQVDFSASKKFQFGGIGLLPKIDFFNALNSDDYSAVATVQYGAAAYKQPSVVLQGRIIRVGVDMTW